MDDEGVETSATQLLSKGRVVGKLHDRRTAARMDARPTGHGRCSSFREPVKPRMGCTFIAPGCQRPDQLHDDIRNGVYVRRMETGSTDPQSGRAVFRVTDADRIRKGRIDVAVEPFLLHVDGATVLASMNRVADDLQFDRCVGVCHRDGQPLATSVGAPTIWIGLATVNG
jgi:TldD protein